MSAINGTGSAGSTYVPSSKDDEEKAESVAGGEESAAQAEKGADTPETLAAYKKSFVATLQSQLAKPYLANVSLDLNISDAGYKKMMEDKNYEQSVLDAFTRTIAHSYTAMSGTVTLTADGTAENTGAEMTRNVGMAKRLFGSSERSLVRSLNLDGLTALAQGTIQYRQGNAGKFELAGLLGTNQMRSVSSYLSSYLGQSSGSDSGNVDATG